MRRNLNVTTTPTGVGSFPNTSHVRSDPYPFGSPFATEASTPTPLGDKKVQVLDSGREGCAELADGDQHPLCDAAALLRWRISSTSVPWIICYVARSSATARVIGSLGLDEKVNVNEITCSESEAERMSKAEELLTSGVRCVALQIGLTRPPAFRGGCRPRLALLAESGLVLANAHHFDAVFSLSQS